LTFQHNRFRQTSCLLQSLFFWFNVLIITGCHNTSNYELDIFSNEINNQKSSLIFSTLENKKKDLSLCHHQRDQNLSTKSIKTYYLEQDKYLVEVLCFLGAYQPNYEYLVIKFNLNEVVKLEKLVFTTFRNQRENLKLTTTDTLTGQISLNGLDKSLSLITKGRGLGDCGSFAIYTWTEDYFELTEFRHKEHCDGIYLLPEDYPLIYP